MNTVRRIGLATLATALTFGLLGISSPAEARDTSWGRGKVAPTAVVK